MRPIGGRLDALVDYFEAVSGREDAVKEVLRRADLTKDWKHVAGHVDPLSEAHFVRHACDVLQDRMFGMRAGLAALDSGTLTNYIGKFSATLRRAIENSQRYYAAIDPAFTYELRVTGSSASFVIQRIDQSLAKYHRYSEYLAFGVLGVLRKFSGVEFLPIEIRFDHASAVDRRQIERAFGFRVVFEAEQTEVLIPLSTLDLAIPTYDPKLRDHLMNYGETLLAQRSSSEPSLRSRVEGTLLNSIPGRIVPANEVASSLGMSRRTLTRKLAEENLSFRQIVDDVKCDLAQTFLKGGYSISEVAFFLDYADQSSFSTAFKRWSGINPREFVSSNRTPTKSGLS
ncbi:MAG: helix-turn-helix domain-containing protein [Rhodobacteraceae bacterium]|nr:helix-turn-helix domain-containing protein [Paracoccaceae bacterium]